MTIQIGLDPKTFRAITLGLSLGDEIGVVVFKDGLLAFAKSPGMISAGVIRLGTDAFAELSLDERVTDEGFKFGISLARLTSFAKGCKATKGAIVRMKIYEDEIEYIYSGARYRYMRMKMIEMADDIKSTADNVMELCRDIMKDARVVMIPTKTLKQSLSDVRKYMKSGDVRFVIEGDRVMFEGADEVSRFGFGLAALAGLGEEKQRMMLTFSMDIMKDLIEAMVEAGDTANMYILSADKPIVFQIPMPSGEAVYAVVPRL